MEKLYLLVLVLLVLSFVPVFQSGGECKWIKRITYSSVNNGRPKLCISDGYIYVLWHRNGHLYLSKINTHIHSTLWTRQLTYSCYLDYLPDFCISGWYLYIVWERSVSGNYELYAMKYNLSSLSVVWTKRLTYSSYNDYNPSICISGRYLYIVWQRYTNNYDIYLMKVDSLDGEVINTVQLSYYSGLDINPVICETNGWLYVVWARGNAYPQLVIAKLNTHEYPVSLKYTYQLTYTGSNNYPSIYESGGYIYITWQRYTGQYDIMCMKYNTRDNSTVWVTQLTSDTIKDADPRGLVSDGYFYVTWVRYVTSDNPEIYLAKIDGRDGSVEWISRLTYYSDIDEEPEIIEDQGYIFMAWLRNATVKEVHVMEVEGQG